MKKPEQDNPLSSGAASERVASGEQREAGEFAAPLGSLRGAACSGRRVERQQKGWCELEYVRRR
jgi:hypothetical protein